MHHLLIGGIATASLVAALFFLRFWRATHDPFFLLFALSFLIDGMDRAMLPFLVGTNEDVPLYYAVRLVSYGLILAAIVLKNRGQRRGGSSARVSSTTGSPPPPRSRE
jgi:hypothetical protein